MKEEDTCLAQDRADASMAHTLLMEDDIVSMLTEDEQDDILNQIVQDTQFDDIRNRIDKEFRFAEIAELITFDNSHDTAHYLANSQDTVVATALLEELLCWRKAGRI